MVAFEESGIALTRQQQNLHALQHPKIGDVWRERGYMFVGEVKLVLNNKYVMVKLDDNDLRFWNLEEYANHFLYKRQPDATWCDVTPSKVVYEKLELEWHIYFHYHRLRAKWKARLDRRFKAPRTFKFFGFQLKIERTRS